MWTCLGMENQSWKKHLIDVSAFIEALIIVALRVRVLVLGCFSWWKSNNASWICSCSSTLEILLSFDLSAWWSFLARTMPSSNAMHPPCAKAGDVGWKASPQIVTLPTTWVSQVGFMFILCRRVFLVKCSRVVLLMHSWSSGTWKSLVNWRASFFICFSVVFRQPKEMKGVTNNNKIIVQPCSS